MDNYLNWTFDHRMHQKPDCDFYTRMTELLAQRPEASQNQHCYFILPNYSFNHQNPEIAGQEKLVIGKLSVQKRLERKKWIYDIRRTDSTSGESICLQITMNNNAYMSLTEQRIVSYSINGKTVSGHNKDNIAFSPFLTSIYGIPQLIRKYRRGIAHFSLMDSHGQIRAAQKIGPLGSDFLRIKGTNVEITGYCLIGYASPPSYWWIDNKKRLLIVSTPLLTYVAGSCSYPQPI